MSADETLVIEINVATGMERVITDEVRSLREELRESRAAFDKLQRRVTQGGTWRVREPITESVHVFESVHQIAHATTHFRDVEYTITRREL